MTNVDTQQPAGAAIIWTGMIAKTHVMALSGARIVQSCGTFHH
ncbi:MAG: hypothetical protein ACI86S_000966 [Paracoccaceae bacterium]|jgi:hypothetical protein